MVLRNDADIRRDQMAEAIISNPLVSHYYISKLMYSAIRKLITLIRLTMLRVKVKFLIFVTDKCPNLYNCVCYKKKEDIYVLLNNINGLAIIKCECSGQCMHDIHSIIAEEMGSAIEKLKPGKKDGSTDVVSHHIINASQYLNVHIATLFTIILRHGLSPDGMLHDTMMPIPKGRWANVSSSDNFRAITLISSLCKLLDVIVMSTTLCMCMVQETIS